LGKIVDDIVRVSQGVTGRGQPATERRVRVPIVPDACPRHTSGVREVARP